jgi:hypothetical protein
MCCNLIKIALGITNIEKQLIGCFALPTKKKSLPKKNKSEK